MPEPTSKLDAVVKEPRLEQNDQRQGCYSQNLDSAIKDSSSLDHLKSNLRAVEQDSANDSIAPYLTNFAQTQKSKNQALFAEQNSPSIIPEYQWVYGKLAPQAKNPKTQEQEASLFDVNVKQKQTATPIVHYKRSQELDKLYQQEQLEAEYNVYAAFMRYATVCLGAIFIPHLHRRKRYLRFVLFRSMTRSVYQNILSSYCSVYRQCTLQNVTTKTDLCCLSSPQTRRKRRLLHSCCAFKQHVKAQLSSYTVSRNTFNQLDLKIPFKHPSFQERQLMVEAQISLKKDFDADTYSTQLANWMILHQAQDPKKGLEKQEVGDTKIREKKEEIANQEIGSVLPPNLQNTDFTIAPEDLDKEWVINDSFLKQRQEQEEEDQAKNLELEEAKKHIDDEHYDQVVALIGDDAPTIYISSEQPDLEIGYNIPEKIKVDYNFVFDTEKKKDKVESSEDEERTKEDQLLLFASLNSKVKGDAVDFRQDLENLIYNKLSINGLSQNSSVARFLSKVKGKLYQDKGANEHKDFEKNKAPVCLLNPNIYSKQSSQEVTINLNYNTEIPYFIQQFFKKGNLFKKGKATDCSKQNGNAKVNRDSLKELKASANVRKSLVDQFNQDHANSTVMQDCSTTFYALKDLKAQMRQRLGFNTMWQNVGFLRFVLGIGDPSANNACCHLSRFVSMCFKNNQCAHRFLFVLFMVLTSVFLLASCSSSKDSLEQTVTVKDPLTFEVSGVRGELQTNVEAYLNSLALIPKARGFFYIREIKETTQKALRAFGYYHPEVKVTLPNKDDPKDLKVKVAIKQGKPLYIRNSYVQVLGEGAQYKVFVDLVNNSGLDSYQILNHGKYEQLKNKIHETAVSLGFFDGKFISNRIMVYQDQNMADIELIYDSGIRYKFGSLVADANSQKLLLPVKGVQNFEIGEDFSSDKINTYIQSLNQTNYYSTVDVHPNISQAKDFQVPIEVSLERRPNNNVRTGFGYSTDEGPRILLEWEKPLLNDRGDSFSFLSTLTQVTQDAQMVYKIPRKNPNLDYYTITASQTHTDMNDTLSDRSRLGFHYIANETGVWRRDYYLNFEYEDYTQGYESGYAFNILPGLRLSRRETSGGFDPKRGYSLTADVTGSSQLWGGDQNFLQLKLGYKGVISPTENSRFLFKLEQGMNLGADALNVPPSYRFFIGGDNSVRGFGYRNYSPTYNGKLTGARYYTVGGVEYQVPIGIANSRVALFVDAGVATNQTEDYKESDSVIFGPGIGYRFLSSYGIFRVDFAVGLQEHEDNNYRIHFAFGPEF